MNARAPVTQIFAFALTLGLTPLARAQSASRCEIADADVVQRMRRDVAFLSNDLLEGREPGTVGSTLAMNYLTRALHEAGVEPAGTDGYLQPFTVEYGRTPTDASAVRFTRNGATRALALTRDFTVEHSPPYSGEGTVEGTMVFAGHGLVSTAARWSDVAHGAPIRNRVMVVLSGPPRPTDPALVDALQRANVIGTVVGKARAAREGGARALIVIDLEDPPHPGLYIPAPGDGIPVVHIRRDEGAWLLGVRPESLVALDREAVVRVIPGIARITVATEVRHVTAMNVLGLVRPRDVNAPAPEQGVAVVGAHYDHIGHGGMTSRSPGDATIHNGADDNASGTATVLELARRVARAPLSRPVVFAWFGAEELGLLGSQHLVAHRTPTTAHVDAMFNFDMVGRLRDCRLFVERTRSSSDFASTLATANGPYLFDARPWEPERGAWGSSDHYSFSSARVPTLFFFTGLHDDYHSPRDDAWRLDVPGMAAIAGLAEALLRAWSIAPVSLFR